MPNPLTTNVKGVFEKLRRAPNTLRNMARRKNKVFDQLQRYGDYMNPGWYMVEGKVAYRVGTVVPEGLLETKGALPAEHRGPKARLKECLAWRLAPPIGMYLRGIRGKQEILCDQLLLTGSGDAKLFAPNKGVVLIAILEPRERERLIGAHRVLGEYLPVTSLTPLPESPLLEEPFVEGQPLSSVSDAHQFATYIQLLRRFKRLVNDKVGMPYGPEFADEAVRCALETTAGIPPVSDLLEARSCEIRAFLSTSPVVPSHGDMNGQNVLLGPNGPFIIDLEWFDLLPFFYDPLRLATAEAQPSVRDTLFTAVLEGMFDSQIDDLFFAAGGRNFSSQREIVLLSVFVMRLYHRRSRASLSRTTVRRWSEPFDNEIFQNSLSNGWMK